MEADKKDLSEPPGAALRAVEPVIALPRSGGSDTTDPDEGLNVNYLTLQQVAERMPGTSAATVWRWATQGVPGPDGMIRLKTARPGRRYYTTDEWLREFTDRLAEIQPVGRRARARGEAPMRSPDTDGQWLAARGM